MPPNGEETGQAYPAHLSKVPRDNVRDITNMLRSEVSSREDSYGVPPTRRERVIIIQQLLALSVEHSFWQKGGTSTYLVNLLS